MANATKNVFSGFHKLAIADRIGIVSREVGLGADEIAGGVAAGGLDAAIADKMIENVLGLYALPFAVAVHVLINGRRRIAPMVVEEPSVVAAASGAAKLVAAGGGFDAQADDPVMIAQVQVYDVPDVPAACARIEQAVDEIRTRVNATIPEIVLNLGGGFRSVQVRALDDRMLVVHLLIDCRDAMGANLVNTAAEALGPRIAQLADAKLGLRILSNLADQRRVRVRCRVPAHVLSVGDRIGTAVADAIEQASRFAEADPYRAATHNKGIMNGVDPVVIATGNDWRAVEAGAHAFAARSGAYRPLAIWRKRESGAGDAVLEGQIELPMALGIVGGTLVNHAAARLALKIAEVRSAADLAMLAASIGLASNLAALRALATEGIQRGHMSLHARSVAMSVGAQGSEIDAVAAEISVAREVTPEAAAIALRRLRSLP